MLTHFCRNNPLPAGVCPPELDWNEQRQECERLSLMERNRRRIAEERREEQTSPNLQRVPPVVPQIHPRRSSASCPEGETWIQERQVCARVSLRERNRILREEIRLGLRDRN